MLTQADERWLDAAARLARPMLGTTAENPTVGALVVDPESDLVLGRGVTALGGRPHAEPQALAEAGEAARGATLYVTLEPCNHHGRTPPCVGAVIAAGIARVVIGAPDPDPRTSGGGIKTLREAGLDVVVAHRHRPSFALHEGFFSRILRRRPHVTLKLAISADGKIGRKGEGNVPVTGEAARAFTHMQRATSDAVMVGGRTALLDDPQLNVRIEGLEQRRPARIVLAGRTPLRPDLRLFATARRQPTWVITKADLNFDLPADVERLPLEAATPDSFLRQALRLLGERGVSRLFVEPGAALTEAFMAAERVDRFHLLLSDTVIGIDGHAATASGTIGDRLQQAGFNLVDRLPLGRDRLRTFEKES